MVIVFCLPALSAVVHVVCHNLSRVPSVIVPGNGAIKAICSLPGPPGVVLSLMCLLVAAVHAGCCYEVVCCCCLSLLALLACCAIGWSGVDWLAVMVGVGCFLLWWAGRFSSGWLVGWLVKAGHG